MNELKVGLLSLLALGSLVLVSLQITSNKATFGEFVEYQTILNDATGIYEKSSIKVAGIVAGLMAFDANDIDGSVEGLLNGLKTAFLTSILGIFTSILYKLLSSTSLIRPKEITSSVSGATPEDILAAIHDQKRAMETLVTTIGGEGDGSIMSQMKLLRP